MAWRSTGVADLTLRPASPLEVQVEGRAVLLVRLVRTIYAAEAYCPHEGGILSEGRVSGDHLVCPIHAAEFSIRTGAIQVDPDGIRPPTGDVPGLRTYPVKLVGGIIHIELG